MEKALVARVEGELHRGAEDYFRENGFVNIPSVPHIVGVTGACENIDTLFSLNYFGQHAFLTQTGQLSLELLVGDLERVCCTIHSFRAEPRADHRHLTEFPLVEFEFKYSGDDGLEQLLSHVEGTLKAMVSRAVRLNPEIPRSQLNILERDLAQPYERISYYEALTILQDAGYELVFGDDLKHEHEQTVVMALGNKPVFITRYPERIKFFNMRRDRKNPELVQSSDLVLPMSGEAVGSAVREENYDLLVEKLKSSEMYRNLSAKGQTFEAFEWYLNAVKDRPVPHAGCGIGLNRVTQYVLGIPDIREATPYPMNCETALDTQFARKPETQAEVSCCH
jgi:asparaginyl-tRNA synthetase